MAESRNHPRRVVYTDEETDSNPDLPVGWTDEQLLCVKYVDDCLAIEKLNYKDAGRVEETVGNDVAFARACKTRDHYRTVEYNAGKKGMKLNQKKTKMIAISATKSYQPRAYIKTEEGPKIVSEDTMRVLDFHFDTYPNVKHHLGVTIKKFKSRVWALRHLKRNGFPKPDLVRVYVSMIRPTAEYCSSVFHAMITQGDSDELERVQSQALKVIYGWRHSYASLLELSGLDRLDKRRETNFASLALKMSESRRFASWFPVKIARHNQPRTTHVERYKLHGGTTERYLNSPLNLMRRTLNELNT